MSQFTRQLIPPLTTGINEQIGFEAKVVRVENPTAAYWYLPNEQRYVQPFVTGLIIPLTGTQNCRIEYAAPPGLTQPAAFGVTQAAIFVYEDKPQGADSGTNLAGNSFGRGVVSRNIPFSGGTFNNIILADAFPVGAPDGFQLAFFGPALTVSGIAVSLRAPGIGTAFTALQAFNFRIYSGLSRLIYPMPIAAQTSLQLQVNLPDAAGTAVLFF